MGSAKGSCSNFAIGFLRKDVAIGMLLPLGMNPFQLVITATILTIYFPFATFAVLVRELGIQDTLKSVLLMIAAAMIVGGIMRLILLGF